MCSSSVSSTSRGLPAQHNPEVSLELDAVVLRSLRRDPGDRHLSAEAMKDDLEGVVRSRRAPADPLPVASRAAAAAATAAAATAATAATAAGADWAGGDLLRPARPAGRRRTVRLISGVAAALLPIAGFGVVHLRGPDQMDGAAMALSLGGVSGGNSVVGGSGRPPGHRRRTCSRRRGSTGAGELGAAGVAGAVAAPARGSPPWL